MARRQEPRISQTRCKVSYAQGHSQEVGGFGVRTLRSYSQIPISQQLGKALLTAQEHVLETQTMVLISSVDELSSSTEVSSAPGGWGGKLGPCPRWGLLLLLLFQERREGVPRGRVCVCLCVAGGRRESSPSHSPSSFLSWEVVPSSGPWKFESLCLSDSDKKSFAAAVRLPIGATELFLPFWGRNSKSHECWLPLT